jgi:DNA-directed RNA polymerase subunit RPC12/RpoP
MNLLHSNEQKNCPRCRSRLVHKSRRRGILERVACALLQVLPYRCEECDHRYFGWRTANQIRTRRTT